jgi:hypothetical protein
MQATTPPLTFGFQDDGRLRDQGDMGALDQGRAIGGTALRLIISRDKLSRKGGGYDFSVYDNIVNEARRRGIHPQVVLDNHSGSGMGDPSKYEQFVKAAAGHFKGRVGTYSLINEPDLRMAPGKYRQLFVRGQKALYSQDKNAKVLFGEFSPHDPVGYAKKVIGKRGLNAAGFAWHPYQKGDPLAPDQDQIANGVLGGIGRLGTLNKQIAGLNIKTRGGGTPGSYLTEFGYGDRGYTAGTTDYAPTGWQRALRKARDNGAREIVAYTMTGSDSPTWDTGLLNPDGTPRPAYDAIRNSRRLLRR